jgi:uncharacterized membrane protein
MDTWVPSVIVILAIVLIPLMPKLLRIRVRFLRWLNWNWAASLLEDHFQAWVLFARIMMFVVAVVALVVLMRALSAVS